MTALINDFTILDPLCARKGFYGVKNVDIEGYELLKHAYLFMSLIAGHCNSVAAQYGYNDDAAIAAQLQQYTRSVAMAIFKKATRLGDADPALELMRSVEPELVLEAILASMDMGYVLSFGRTRAGDAVAISIYDGKDNEREYPRDTEELRETLKIIISLSAKIRGESEARESKAGSNASRSGTILSKRRAVQQENDDK